jgi:Na+/H+ antiporter NhaD/arsenite permease-like protein
MASHDLAGSQPPMTHGSPSGDGSKRIVVGGIALLLLVCTAAALLELPQRRSALTVDAGHGAERPAPGPTAGDDRTRTVAQTPPGVIMVLPFVLLLLAIAAFPLVPRVKDWWENNLHRFLVAAGLGLVTLLYYALVHAYPVDRHFLRHAVVGPSPGSVSWGVAWTVFENAILGEFVPFVVLLFSLYTISGGIRIEGDLPAHPLTNSAFLAVGALLANVIGTTGAAMLLVRPLLETNSERRHVRHTAVFFVFIVCNCGGCLLPIGDPPLFLGYLQGVDFLWTLSLWRPWLLVNGTLVALYYAWDHFFCYPREAWADLAADESRVRRMRFAGLWPNAASLALVVASVALLDPAKPLVGSDWHPWPYLREAVQLALVLLSLVLGQESVRRANGFNYGAIVEVAALFFGIFLCMQPALQILEVKGDELGIDVPWKFFWATGAISSVLDNAPTYLVFFKAAQSLDATGGETIVGIDPAVLTAISLGAVFMGAMTYIGNGPNFMVKSIAEQSGVRMPGFFGYMVYSCCVLIPLFALVTVVFLR